MKRTDADGSVEGKFSDGSPEQGLPATVINAEFLNNIQEEICNFIEQAGLSLNGSDQQQLWKALLAVFAAGISIGDSAVHGSGSGATSSAILHHDKLGVSAAGDVSVKIFAEYVELLRGQKSAKIGSKIVSNNIIVTIDEIVELAKNLIIKGLLGVEGNASFDQDLTVAGALNVAGAVSSSSGFFGGIAGGNGDSANFPLIRADQISPRTNGSPINVNGILAGAFSGTLSGFLNGSWIPGDNAYFKRSVSTIYPVAEMASLPDGAVAVFYNKPSEASYVISWRDMDYTQRVKTVDAGTPFVFMKKKNSQNQDCGMLLCVGEVGGTP